MEEKKKQKKGGQEGTNQEQQTEEKNDQLLEVDNVEEEKEEGKNQKNDKNKIQSKTSEISKLKEQKNIVLKGVAAKVYQTAMKEGVLSWDIGNKEVNKFLAKIGGYRGKGNILYIPSFSPDGQSKGYLPCSLHPRHGGRDNYPVKTLHIYLGGVLERANLSTVVSCEE